MLAALILFLAIWGLKSVPWVQAKVLTSDRAKLLATGIMSLGPVAMLLIDPAVSATEAWSVALMTILGAMGLQGGLKALVGEKLRRQLGLSQPPAEDSETVPKAGS